MTDLTSTRRLWALRALGLAATALLISCGGGGGAGSAPLSLSGTVVDGPIEGAQVFLDLNGNMQHDVNEPLAAPTDAAGRFSVDVAGLTSAQLQAATLITHIADSARDADDQGKTLAEAGKRGFSLLAPASAYIDAATGRAGAAFVSPFTTLVAKEMAFNNLTLAQAREQVRTAYGLTNDPMVDFVARDDQEMGRKARALAVALGEAQQAARAAQTDEEAGNVRERLALVAEAVSSTVPAVVKAGGFANADLPSSTVLAQLRTDVAGKAGEVARGRGPSAGQEFQDFVVVFKDSVDDPASEAAKAMVNRGGTIRFTYTRAIKGFAVRLPAPAVPAFLEAMSKNPNVDYVESDTAIQKQQTTQSNATWGLDRADQRDLPLSGSYTYARDGSGVRAYVVDTGILAGHAEFGDRVLSGYTAIADVNGTSDCNGHGTHVAGTIGGATWGVAKNAKLVPVRVLDCNGSGTSSTVIAGLDWVAANAVRPAVANLSLGGGASSSLDKAVANTVAQGITVVVAAGNSNADACNYSPAREASALTIGASTSSDARASYSNYGSCLDLFAPGSAITSAWYTSTTASNTISGTSMATPHVSGLAALTLAGAPGATPAEVGAVIKNAASASKITSAGAGSPNLLLYTLADTGSVGPAPTPRSVSVAALSGTASLLRKGWRASISVAVKDAAGALVAGASVTGAFTAGGSGQSCTTGSNGACSITSGLISRSVSQTTFTVSGISGSNLVYAPGSNVQSSLTVSAP